MSKSARMIIRIEPEQAAQFERAAKFAEKSVSEWLRDLGAAAVAPPPETLKPGDVFSMAGSYVENPPVPIRRVDDTGPSPLECPSCVGVGTGIDPRTVCAECGGTGIVKEITIVQDMSREEFEAQYPPAELSTNGQKRTPAELAASISGLMVGMGDALKVAKGRTLFNPEHPIPLTGYAAKAEARREELKAEGVDLLEQIFPSDTPEEPVRSWAEVWDRTSRRGDAGAEEWRAATEHVRWPKEKFKTPEARIAFLDRDYPLTDTQGGGR